MAALPEVHKPVVFEVAFVVEVTFAVLVVEVVLPIEVEAVCVPVREAHKHPPTTLHKQVPIF